MRKATDVLLSVEQMVRELLGHARNQDMLLKNLTRRVDALSGPQPFLKNQEPPAAEPPTPQAQRPTMPGLKPGVVLKKVKSDQEHFQFEEWQPNGPPKQVLVKHGEEAEEEEEVVEELELDTKPKGKRRDARYVSKPANGKNVPVQQKVLYPDGKALTSAHVEIFAKTESEGKQVWGLVKSLKTNNTGKWTNSLPAGNYMIKVSKKGEKGKPPVEMQGPLTIPNSEEPVQLKPIQAN